MQTLEYINVFFTRCADWQQNVKKRAPQHSIVSYSFRVSCVAFNDDDDGDDGSKKSQKAKRRRKENVGKQEERVFQKKERRMLSRQSVSSNSPLHNQWPPLAPHPFLPVSVRAEGAQNLFPLSRSLPSVRPTPASPTASLFPKVRLPSIRKASSMPVCGARSPSGRSR